jgi:hypothetical protein
LGIPISTLHDMKCDKDNPVIVPCSSALKPTLTEQHKLLCACYCISKIDPETQLYDDFYESVHVDEKGVFITEKDLHLYIAPDEEVPNRFVVNKNHILKVSNVLVCRCLPSFQPSCR